MISESHEKMILDEYANAGLKPVYRSDGVPVTLGLARKLGTPLSLLNTRATAASPPLDRPAYQEAVVDG